MSKDSSLILNLSESSWASDSMSLTFILSCFVEQWMTEVLSFNTSRCFVIFYLKWSGISLSLMTSSNIYWCVSLILSSMAIIEFSGLRISWDTKALAISTSFVLPWSRYSMTAVETSQMRNMCWFFELSMMVCLLTCINLVRRTNSSFKLRLSWLEDDTNTLLWRSSSVTFFRSSRENFLLIILWSPLSLYTFKIGT